MSRLSIVRAESSDSRRARPPMRLWMTTTSPLIRRVGNGYCASWNGIYVHDEDLQLVLARIAELMPKADSNEHGGSKRREQNPADAAAER